MVSKLNINMNKEKFKQSFKLYAPPVLVAVIIVLLTSREYDVWWLFIVLLSPLIGLAVGFCITIIYRLFRPMTQVEFTKVFILISALTMCGYIEEGYFEIYRKFMRKVRNNHEYAAKGYQIFKADYGSFQYLSPDREDLYLRSYAEPSSSYSPEKYTVIKEINYKYEQDPNFKKVVSAKFYPSQNQQTVVVETSNEDAQIQYWQYKLILEDGLYSWRIQPYDISKNVNN